MATRNAGELLTVLSLALMVRGGIAAARREVKSTPQIWAALAKSAILSIVVVGVLGGWNSEAGAAPISWWEKYLQEYFIRQDTKAGLTTQKTEDLAIDAIEKMYWGDHFDLPQIGQAIFNGEYPVGHVFPGDTAVLSFVWLDPTTTLPTTGPAIASVMYEVNLDPDQFNVLQLVGISADAGSNFSFPWQVTGFEPLILATPLDALGNPIVIPDPIIVAGALRNNVAVGIITDIPIPEPAILTLMGIGTLGLLGRRRRRSPPE